MLLERNWRSDAPLEWRVTTSFAEVGIARRVQTAALRSFENWQLVASGAPSGHFNRNLKSHPRLPTSRSHGARWKAAIRRYIGTMPLSTEAPGPGMHIMSCPP